MGLKILEAALDAKKDKKAKKKDKTETDKHARRHDNDRRDNDRHGDNDRHDDNDCRGRGSERHDGNRHSGEHDGKKRNRGHEKDAVDRDHDDRRSQPLRSNSDGATAGANADQIPKSNSSNKDAGLRCPTCNKYVKDADGLWNHQNTSVRCATRRGEKDARVPCPRCGKYIAKGQRPLEQHFMNGCSN